MKELCLLNDLFLNNNNNQNNNRPKPVSFFM